MSKAPKLGRDNFPRSVAEKLARQVAYICSNPECRVQTVGSTASGSSVTSIGVAAHICAASIGGPRYDIHQSLAERTSESNGIWLCNNCSRKVDNDESAFTVTVLRAWKAQATAASKSRLGKKVVNDADVESRLASAFKTLPSGQSLFAISNVHRATQQYLEELDSRLRVDTSHGPAGTSYDIRAKVDVPLKMTWTTDDTSDPVGQFKSLLEQGRAAKFNVTTLSMSGSPLLEELINQAGPGVLHIIPHSDTALVRLMVEIANEGFEEFVAGDGRVTQGSKQINLETTFFKGALRISLSSTFSGDTSISVAVDYQNWNTVDIRYLRDFEQLRQLFNVLKGGRRIRLEANDEKGNRLQQDLDLSDEKDFVSGHHWWLRYISKARIVANRYNLQIPCNVTHQVSRGEYEALFDATQTCEGKKTHEHGKADPVELRAQITQPVEITPEGAYLEIEFQVSAPTIYNVFDCIVTMPPLCIAVEGHGYATKPGNYDIGDEVEFQMNMAGNSKYRFFFLDEPLATIARKA